MMIVDKDLLSIQQARILAENAFEAQKRLAAFSQEKLDVIVEHMADEVEKHAEELAALSHEETDCGNRRDKLRKNLFVCRDIRLRLRGMRCVGVLREDPVNGIAEIGVPLGVIAALCPATSPVSSTISTALLAVKAGNAVVFSPHPCATASMKRALDIMIAAAAEHGLPEGCLSYMDAVTKSGTVELMRHPATALVMVTAVRGMFRAAREAGKPLIYGGTGNGPAFIERTANIRQAVRDIVISKTFDNGVAPSAEQAVVVDACVEREVRTAFLENGAHFMSEAESHALAALFFQPDGRRKKGVIGLPAETLARRAGFCVPEQTSLLIAERKYVCDEDPYARELLSPVLAYYVEDDWLHACEKCIELLLHERNAHTLVIHSGDEAVIRQFALKKPVARLLVNTPAAFGGMGVTTNLFPAMTLGSGVAGYGFTSDNVSPMNLVYIRKVGYGVRRLENLDGEARPVPNFAPGTAGGGSIPSEKIRALQSVLHEVIRAMDSPTT